MLSAIAQLATQVVMALLPELVATVRESRDEAQARTKIRSLLKRRAHEAAHNTLARELSKR